MSDKKKKKKRKKESGFTSDFLYVLLLLVLFACLAGLYLHSRRMHQQEEKMREEIIQKEQALSNNWIGGAETGFQTLETSAETDAETDEKENKDGADQDEEEMNAPESDREEEPVSELDTAAENADINAGAAITNALAAAADQANADTETTGSEETEPTDVHTASILVLNGTKVPGVASYWQTQLQNAGFTQVATATYTQTVQAQTVIYSDSLEVTDEFLALFPQAVLEKGTLTEGILPASGETLPDQVDIYILVGRADAKNK